MYKEYKCSMALVKYVYEIKEYIVASTKKNYK